MLNYNNYGIVNDDNYEGGNRYHDNAMVVFKLANNEVYLT